MDEREPAPVPLLRVEAISKSFPGVLALKDVSLEVRPGEVLGLVGENGAGKSTLMKILSGVYAPDGGQILLDGLPVNIHDPRHAQRLGISIIYQEFNLMPNLSVEENVFVGREPNSGGVRPLAAVARKDASTCSTSLGSNLIPERSCATSLSLSSRWSRLPRHSPLMPAS